jgi:UPF0755 protein
VHRGVIIAVTALLALPFVIGGLLVTAYLTPMRTAGGIVLVRPGMGARAVADELMSERVLSHPATFLLFARLRVVDRDLQAGRYLIPANVTIQGLLALLAAGPNLRERVTIPEGSRAEDIAGILSRVAAVDSAMFVALAGDSSAPRRLGVPGPTLEGYLFPETYEFSWGVTPEEAAAIMVAEYELAMTPALRARAESLGLDEREMVTLASIIEAETGLAPERPRVSAVYHNRLREGWNLEADPTVRYATRRFTEDITLGDLTSQSPYNTYRFPGLPPGPICSPGLASLVAAVYPSGPADEFFFVARGDGGHTFSRTAAEHARAKAVARKRMAGAAGGG